MSADVPSADDETADEHAVLAWLRDVVKRFDRIYVRRQEPRTGRWESVRLTDLSTEEAFWWVSFWASRGHTPYSVAKESCD
jgi:hypothetical protein